MAIASLVFALLYLCGLGSVLALVFGHQARREIRNSGGAQTGEGLATAGIVLGWIGVVGAFFLLLLFLGINTGP